MHTNIFNDEIFNSSIIHIPHAGVDIPDYTGFDMSNIKSEIIKLTDWATNDIFNVTDVTTIQPKFSRVFCDVERFEDNDEEMFKHGRGFFYTKTDEGNELRKNINNIKSKVYNNYYKPHHKLLTKVVSEKLKEYGFATIYDVHSFTDKPFNTDTNKEKNRPDICLGIDSFHTPPFLIKMIKNVYEKEGLTVKINSPYSGTIVPLEYFNSNHNVYSIMIEVNRKLYMQDDTILIKKVLWLNQIFNKIFDLYL